MKIKRFNEEIETNYQHNGLFNTYETEGVFGFDESDDGGAFQSCIINLEDGVDGDYNATLQFRSWDERAWTDNDFINNQDIHPLFQRLKDKRVIITIEVLD